MSMIFEHFLPSQLVRLFLLKHQDRIFPDGFRCLAMFIVFYKGKINSLFYVKGKDPQLMEKIFGELNNSVIYFPKSLIL